MIDERLIMLMNGAIDGVNSPEEQAELDKCLADDAKAKAYYDELLDLSTAFADVKEQMPPVALKSAILEATVGSEKHRAGFTNSLRGIFAHRIEFRVAYLAAAAVIIAIGLGIFLSMQEARTTTPDLRNLYGTLLTNRDLKLQAACEFSLSGQPGKLRLHMSPEGSSLIQLEFASLPGHRLELLHDRSLELSSYQVGNDLEHGLQVMEDRIRLSLSGRGEFLCSFAGRLDSSKTLSLRAYMADSLLFEKQLTPIQD